MGYTYALSARRAEHALKQNEEKINEDEFEFFLNYLVTARRVNGSKIHFFAAHAVGVNTV
jgi:hypothetical protein